MHNLQIINVFIFPFATYWLEGPGDLLRKQGKKNTRFHLIPCRVESYNVKNTCWKESIQYKSFSGVFFSFFFFFFSIILIHLAFTFPGVYSNGAN